MGHFILKRLLAMPLLAFGTATVVFFIVRLLPGDPVLLFISPSVPQDVATHLRHAFGLDQPLWVQYAFWIREVFTGSLGYSYTFQRDVFSVIGDALPSTIILALCAIAAELALGIAAAVAALRMRNTAVERWISGSGIIAYTMPTFWIAFILIQAFAVRIPLFPSSHLHSVSAETLPLFSYATDAVMHLALPVAAIALPGAAGIALFLRSSLIKTSEEQFVLTARSMGVAEKTIFYSYMLPNAVSSVVTISGLSLGSLLTGALITESIFALPGMGRLIVTAIFARDYPLVVGCVVAASFLYIGVNIVTDIIHHAIDPRVERFHE